MNSRQVAWRLRPWLGRAGAGVLAAAAAWAAPSLATEQQHSPDVQQQQEQQQLPTDKLACRRAAQPPRTPVVLVSCGSFNPPTIMHLRMCELAADALGQQGYDVWGCYLSPVANAYGKPGLAPAADRLAMCRAAVADSDKVMVSGWEAGQAGYTRTYQVLQYVQQQLQTYVSSHGPGAKQRGAPAGKTTAAAGSSSSSAGGDGQQQAVPRVMLLCGADLLSTINTPGVWKDPDKILTHHGIIVVTREGTQVQQLFDQPGSLLQQHRGCVHVVQEPVQNGISSTVVRQELQAGRSVKYLVPDGVLAYIKQHGLYMHQG